MSAVCLRPLRYFENAFFVVNVSTGEDRAEINDSIDDTLCDSCRNDRTIVVSPVNILLTATHFSDPAVEEVSESSLFDLLLSELLRLVLRQRNVLLGDVHCSLLGFDRSIELLYLSFESGELCIFRIGESSHLCFCLFEQCVKLCLLLGSFFDQIFHLKFLRFLFWI